MATTTTAPNPAISSVAAPIATTEKTGVVFPRVSTRAQVPGTTTLTQGFSSLYNPILKPVPGYLTAFDITVIAAGGTGTVAVASADGIWAVFGQIVLKDIKGTPAVSLDGYGLKCVNTFGGQSGALGFGNDKDADPSLTAMQTDGNFQFSLSIPLEFGMDGYCSWPLQNTSALPELNLNINPDTAIYSTAPTTLPTISIKIDEPYWIQPQDSADAPMDLGSSHQWTQSAITQTVPSAQFVDNLTWPTTGTFNDTLIAVLRDSTGARIAAWPSSDLQLWIDGQPNLNETFLQRCDKIYKQFGINLNTTEWAGVLVYSYRDTVSSFVSPLDNLDRILQTTPATSITLRGTFGTIANAPARITTYTGQLFPTGAEPPYGAEA